MPQLHDLPASPRSTDPLVALRLHCDVFILSTGSTMELFYQDTDDSHAYVSAKNTHLRKTLDKKAAGTVICSFAYELDAAGNRVGVLDKDSKYTSYILDPSYQLKSETKWSAKTTTATRELQYLYAYDPNGNRIAQQHDGTLTSYTIGDNNELTAAGASSLTYDQFGNTLTYGLLTFTWDSEGHMLTGTDASSFPNKVDTHEVDGDGRRMRAKWANAADWTNFVYDELESGYPAILAEYTLISGAFTIKSLNTHGLGLVNTNREGTKRYFHFDGLSSTWALTDGSKVVQDTYEYSAYGVLQGSTGTSLNPARFLGRWGWYADSSRGSTLGSMTTPSGAYLISLAIYLSGFNHGTTFLAAHTCDILCPKGTRYVATCTKDVSSTITIKDCTAGTGCGSICKQLEGTRNFKTPGTCSICIGRGEIVTGCIPTSSVFTTAETFHVLVCTCNCTVVTELKVTNCCCCAKKPSKRPPKPPEESIA